MEEVIFPLNGVLKTIGDSAFFESNLESITIPASVETIGEYAFNHDGYAETQKIKTLIFEENSNLKNIGKCAFRRNSLVSVIIPSLVTTIGERAFESQKDSEGNATLQSVIVKRSKEDFLANVTVEDNWFDKSLVTEPTYDPS